jgi:ZIP family zinc transporter
MVSFLIGLHPVVQALIATSFTWFVTALGAAVIFVSRSVNRKTLDFMLGFAGGIMIAASIWSLIIPAIEMSTDTGVPAWLPATIGFMIGAIFLLVIDKVLPHLHIGFPDNKAEGISTTWHRSILLVLAITLHNIPEGLAVGVAFGAAAAGFAEANITGAIALAIGIGLQNFPEGLAISAPLRREGMSCLKSFWYGQLSAVVEPIAGVIGAAIVFTSRSILPYALGFAAGAMMFVVVEQIIPESQRGENTDLATFGAIFGFIIMMILDVALS